jgi:hypothetical protein
VVLKKKFIENPESFVFILGDFCFLLIILAGALPAWKQEKLLSCKQKPFLCCLLHVYLFAYCGSGDQSYSHTHTRQILYNWPVPLGLRGHFLLKRMPFKELSQQFRCMAKTKTMRWVIIPRLQNRDLLKEYFHNPYMCPLALQNAKCLLFFFFFKWKCLLWLPCPCLTTENCMCRKQIICFQFMGL